MSDTQVFLVPTPIGNLEDITLRAIRILKEVNFVLAEDTRTSGKLLKHYDINTSCYAYHMHNEHTKTMEYIKRAQSGEKFALISDGGTPGISDPGFLMVKACQENNIKYETLPGPTAFVPAIVNSGFPNHQFLFVGFLPHKKGRKTELQRLNTLHTTLVLYESPHRIGKLMKELNEFFDPQTPISMSREISKLHEETLIHSLEEWVEVIDNQKFKGEIVICINNQL